MQEELVVVELSGIINNDFLSKCRGTCKILDIDSEKPMMQVGHYVFSGEYEVPAIITSLIKCDKNGITTSHHSQQLFIGWIYLITVFLTILVCIFIDIACPTDVLRVSGGPVLRRPAGV
ncbi:General transcription factor 3C polypeptide 6 [Liparis tanakae]|uniref:General transcription factor 3C polypeptide 6 n=1 Tax=Liparis tanakae TaxID=230148 RepID=A0A4Z2FFM7_9TELE|nr:General transcription factor 3C polypeptide 6 [Liparis tanakae]